MKVWVLTLDLGSFECYPVLIGVFSSKELALQTRQLDIYNAYDYRVLPAVIDEG